MLGGDQADLPDERSTWCSMLRSFVTSTVKSTNITVIAVERLNRGLTTTGTLIPAWASLFLVGPDAATVADSSRGLADRYQHAKGRSGHGGHLHGSGRSARTVTSTATAIRSTLGCLRAISGAYSLES